MARPKKFPDKADAEPRLSAGGGNQYRPDGLEGFDLAKHDRERMAREIAVLVHPSPAGYYDPVTITSVIDMILRLEHDTTIRPRDLVPLLSQHYPNLIWKPIVVGRVLSDLTEAASAQEEPAIQKSLSSGGHRYSIAVTPDAWRWLVKTRDAMAEMAFRQIEIERATGEPVKRTSFPFEVLDAA
jgi:hypothetical protein